MVVKKDLGVAMKAGMRHLASGVAIAATRGADGVARGMTVTSITSVSDQPPSLLVCLHRDSSTFRSLAGTDRFSVSILRQDQQDIADRCAFTPEDDRFVVGEWQDHGEGGVPFLSGALACFLCRVVKKIDYGTHCIVIGDVVDVVMDQNEKVAEAAKPLIYFRGEYVKL